MIANRIAELKAELNHLEKQISPINNNLKVGFSFRPLSDEYDIVKLSSGRWKFMTENPIVCDSINAGFKWIKVLKGEKVTIMPGLIRNQYIAIRIRYGIIYIYRHRVRRKFARN